MMVEASSFKSRDRRRAFIVAGIVAVAAVIGLAGWTLAPRDAASSSADDRSRLSIDVVAPVEPVPVEGKMLEVGTLNHGFDRSALDRQPDLATADDIATDAYAGEDWPPLEPVNDDRPMMSQMAPMAVATVTTTDPLADGSRLFGFDRRPVATPVEAPLEAAPQTTTLRSDAAKNTQEFFE